MTDTCGCCEGVQQLTPTPIVNRPGLNALAYRTGIYSTFLETMLARLSSLGIPLGELGPLLQHGDDPNKLVYPLAALTTRAPNDPSIAMLDAWATVADVLTFYQERIANEGYLRTATERRSILELAKLVAYKLRPGVAASAYLSFTLDNGQQITIPAGTRAQSLPGQGQLPQAFETSYDLDARSDWNNLQPRMSIPQYITQLDQIGIDTNTSDGSVYLAGTSTNLKKNDSLLFVFGNEVGRQVFTHLKDIDPHPADKYTRVTFQPEFTPLVILRNALQFVETYLDLPAFDVSPGDLDVGEVTGPLEVLKALLLLGQSILVSLRAGKSIDDLKEPFAALVLMSALILWGEEYLNLLEASTPLDDPQIKNVVRELNNIESGLENFLPQIKDATLKTLMTSVQQQLKQFLAQSSNPAVSVATLLADLNALLTGVQQAIEQYLLQAVQFSGDAQLSALLSRMPGAAQALRQALLSPLLRHPVYTGLIRQVVRSQDLLATLGQLLLRELSVLGKYTHGELFFPPEVVHDTLLTWCGVYNRAVQNNFAQVAAWVGALITDVVNTLRDIPGFSDQTEGICVPTVTTSLSALVSPSALAKQQLAQPASSARLKRNISDVFARKGDTAIQLLSTLNPTVDSSTLYLAYSQAKVSPPPTLQDIYALRVKAAPFGNNAPKQATTIKTVVNGNDNFTTSYSEWPLADTQAIEILLAPYDATKDTNVNIQFTFKQNGETFPKNNSFPIPTASGDVSFTDDGGPDIKVDVTTSNASATPPPLDSITISIAALSRTITIKPSGTEWNVEVNSDNPHPVDVQYDANGNLLLSEGFYAPSNILDLDARYDHILPDSWVVIEYADGRNNGLPLICKVNQVQSLSRADYGMSAKVTRLILDQVWLTAGDTTLAALRNITVYAQSEVLAQADLPLTDDIAGSSVELDRLYDGLQSGRWVIVSGERTDIPNTSGVMDSELMMLESVTQDVRQANPTLQFAVAPSAGGQYDISVGGEPHLLPNNQPVSATLPGDTVHTTLHFATPLAKTYKRSTVTISGNVVDATQGETQTQILGSGNGSSSMQQFTLAKSPLTYIPAVTPSGVESTLQISINGIVWHETDDIDAAGPNDRVYTTQIDDLAVTTVIFGDGVHGSRLPTGIENVKAVYRAGMGISGNVGAGQISQLVTRPLGVKGVNNPLPATGGADKESRDQARLNVPLASLSLERIVSVQDYTSFTRTFAGIGKADAVRMSDGYQQVVDVTIAGLDDIPISPTSDLYRSLLQALRQFGDPATPVEVGVAEILLLVVSIKMRVQTDYLFDDVSLNVRAALLDAFSFTRRDLGQPVFQSEVLSVIQDVAGVAYVELEKLAAVDQQQLQNALNIIHQQELQATNSGTTPPAVTLADLLGLGTQNVIPVQPARPDQAKVGNILPAQLAFLSPDIPDTLIINELTSTRFVPPVAKRKRPHTYGGKQ